MRKKTDSDVLKILTSEAKNLNELRQTLAKYTFEVNLMVDVSNIAELMLKSDLAIGSGGTTSWERCVMALPSIVVVQADNQKFLSEKLETIL